MHASSITKTSGLMGFTVRMREKINIAVFNRRAFLLSAGAASLVAGSALGLAQAALAEDMASTQLERTRQFEDAFKALVAGAKPVEGRIAVDLPEIAENGNFVPVTISVDSPMTQGDHVTAIHVLSTANPMAKIATFHLSPVNGLAKIQSRIRLAKTQDVVVLAQMSTGELAIATQTVKVTIGGCSN